MGQLLHPGNLAVEKNSSGESREHLLLEILFPVTSNTLPQLESSHQKEYFEPGKNWKGSSALSLNLGCTQEIFNDL